MDYYRPEMTYEQSHLVEVQLQYKNFKATVVFYLGGNVAGASVLRNAIENFADGEMGSFPTENELNQRHLDFTDPEASYSEAETIYLFKEDGSNIGFHYEDEVLGDLVVSAKIIEYQEK